MTRTLVIAAALACVVSILWFIALTAATAVSAQGADRGALRAACTADAKRLCAEVQPGGGRIVQCLRARDKELSSACRDALAAAGR
jgi:cysteine rich repeat protein